MGKTSVAGDAAPPLSVSHKRQRTGEFDGEGEGFLTASETPDTPNNAVANPFSVMFSDPNLLNCCICHEPLTVPVFQCLSGHMACSGCHVKLQVKCPSCPNQTARVTTYRNLPIETILQSIKISCPNEIYGCREKYSYCNRKEHEKTCVYGKYPCPFTPCSFSGSPKELSLHLKKQHTDSVVPLHFDDDCRFSVSSDREFVVFVGEGDDDGVIFVLDLRGTRMGIGCIQDPGLSNGRRGYGYTLFIEDKFTSSSFRSFTHSLRNDYLSKEKVANPTTNFLTALQYLSPSGDKSVLLDLRVCKQDCNCNHCILP